MAHRLISLLLLLFLAGCGGGSGSSASGGEGGNDNPDTSSSGGTSASASVSYSQGTATTVTSNLFLQGQRVAGVGTVTSSDGETWTVPAQTEYESTAFPWAFDLYNEYEAGHDYATASAALAALGSTDIVEVDADGEVVTGYIFADNYFELWVNGKAIAKDPVPFTGFNSCIVRFKAKQPFTVAMKLVDWEENLGTGTEANGDSNYHPGDGGLVAVFKDASDNVLDVTGSHWKAQTYYTAPITDKNCLDETARTSSGCSTADLTGIDNVYAAHWETPDGWTGENYDDADWPAASTYSNATVGVDNKPSYTNFTALFDDSANDAAFIWSSNLVLDNLVLVRATIGESTGSGGGTSTDNGDLTLTSPAVKSRNILPFSYTCDGVNLEGETGGLSPALAFSNVPEGTESFAVTMHIDKGEGDQIETESLWVLYDIPGSVTSIDGGTTGGGTLGITEQGQQAYFPPCSQGVKENNYTLTLYALPQKLNLPGATTDYAALTAAAKAVALESTTLVLSNVRYNPDDETEPFVPTKVPVTCDEKSEAFNIYNSTTVACQGNTMTVTSLTGVPERSSLDVDKLNVGTEAWIGRVPLPSETTWSFPLQPTYLASPTSNVNVHHPIGITVDGIPILHYAKEGDAGETAQLGTDYSDRDTVLLGELDQCGAHAGNGEDYHYHYAPLCMMDTHDPSQPVAYMFDGIPLYYGTAGGTVDGPTSVNYGGGRYDQLDYRPRALKTGAATLDECNAYDLNGDGAVSGYVYYTTKTAPYTIGCFRGEADQATSVFYADHWSPGDRDLSWAGSDVLITDYDTLTFDGKTWNYMEMTPDTANDKIPAGKSAQILYRALASGETGYEAGRDCWAFRYRLDKTVTDGSEDTAVTHCR